MDVRLIWYGCPPASMGVSTPTVEYNSPPMATNFDYPWRRLLRFLTCDGSREPQRVSA